ncbi:hypothetical protein QUC31_004306 [Theobroma cacao]
MEALDEMRKTGFRLNYPCYSILLVSLAKSNMGVLASSVYKRMVAEGFVLSAIDYRTIINALSKIGFVCQAEMFISKALKLGFGLGTHISTSLVLGYCRQNDLPEAFRVLDVMSKRDGCGANSVTYSILIHGLCEVGRVEEAFSLKEGMKEKGCQPSTRTYTVLVKALCDNGLIGKAFDLIFELMNSLGVNPDGHSYTAIIDGLCKQGSLKLANGLWGKMIKKGINPDEVTFTALMDGFCKIGNTGDASKLFKMMIVNGCLKTCHAFNVFLHILSKECKLTEEYAFFGKILKHGLVPSVVTYTILVGALFQAGKVEQSLSMLKLMKQVGCPPNVYTYTVVVNGLCQIGRVDDAERILHLMFDLGVPPNHVTYTILVKAHVNAGRLNRALDITSFMVKNGYEPNCHIYSALLAGFVSSNKVTIAGSSSFISPLDFGSPPTAENYDECVSRNVLKEMDLDHALKLRAEIEKFGGSVLDFYNFLIVGLCKGGRIVVAEHLTKDILKDGLYPDKACFSIIDWHSKNSNCNECLEVLDLILSHGFLPSFASYCSVIHCMRNKGKIKEAQRLFSDLMKDNSIGEAKAVLPHIEFLVNCDEPEKCVELLKLIEQMANRERPVI